MGALREKMIAEMKLRNFASRTQKSYLAVMIGLAKHYRQFPDQLTQEQIRTYLLHLQERGLSSSSQNVAISGLRFFYQQVLGWNEEQLFLAQTALDYRARYTHRVALSNDRILQVENGKVILSYRDRKDGDRKKIMTLDAQEFIRRILLHVLPDGFMRIRHFGFLANRSKKQALAQCRKLLDLDSALPLCFSQPANALLLKLTGVDLSRCPCCYASKTAGTSCSGLGRASSGRVIVELADVATGSSAH